MAQAYEQAGSGTKALRTRTGLDPRHIPANSAQSSAMAQVKGWKAARGAKTGKIASLPIPCAAMVTTSHHPQRPCGGGPNADACRCLEPARNHAWHP